MVIRQSKHLYVTEKCEECVLAAPTAAYKMGLPFYTAPTPNAYQPLEYPSVPVQNGAAGACKFLPWSPDSGCHCALLLPCFLCAVLM